MSDGRRTLYRPFQCHSVDNEKLSVHEERLHKHSSTLEKAEVAGLRRKREDWGAEGTSESFCCTAKLLKRGFHPFDGREAHHNVLPHQLVTIPDLSAETLCPKLLEQTRHIEHTSARNRVPWKSFPELLRAKQRQVTMCRSLLSPASICCFPEDGTE